MTARLGVVAALGAEAHALAGRRLPAGAVAALPDDGLVAVAGVGAKRARRAAAQLLDRGASALMSWGCAAALSEGLGVGSLVLPRMLVTPAGEQAAVTAAWHEALARELAGSVALSTGALAHTSELLTTPAHKRALAERCTAVAADMESFAVGACARAAGVPCVAVRAVSDSAAMAVPAWVPGTVDGYGGIALPGLARALLAHPGDWLTLARLAWGFHRAHASLVAVAPRVTANTRREVQSGPRPLVG